MSDDSYRVARALNPEVGAVHGTDKHAERLSYRGASNAAGAVGILQSGVSITL